MRESSLFTGLCIEWAFSGCDGNLCRGVLLALLVESGVVRDDKSIGRISCILPEKGMSWKLGSDDWPILLSAEPREFGAPKGPGRPPLRLRMKSSALATGIVRLALACVVDIDPDLDPAADRFLELPAGLAKRACSSLSGSWSKST